MPNKFQKLTNGKPVGTSVLSTDIGSGAATSGQVIIADGVGGSSYSSTPTLSGPVVGTQATSDNSTKAASTAFVATAITNALAAFQPLESTYAASTVNIVGTYLNGAAGVGATFTVTATGAFTIDGTTPPVNSRILLKNQTSGFQNGVYDLTVAGTTGVSPVLTRSLDYDTASDINAGDLIPVVNGTANAITSWLQTANVTTVGTDSLVFTQYSTNPASTPTFYRAGQQTISNASTSQAITFSSTLGTTNYGISVSMKNTTDANPQFQPLVITVKSATGFTVTWNAPTDSANYVLEFTAMPNV